MSSGPPQIRAQAWLLRNTQKILAERWGSKPQPCHSLHVTLSEYLVLCGPQFSPLYNDRIGPEGSKDIFQLKDPLIHSFIQQHLPSTYD